MAKTALIGLCLMLTGVPVFAAQAGTPPGTIPVRTTNGKRPTKTTKRPPPYQPDRYAVRTRQRFSVKAFGGLSFYSPTALNTQLGGSAFSGGSLLGAEFGYALDDKFTLLVRIEQLKSHRTDNDAGTGNIYDLNLSATPISFGAEYLLSPGQFSFGMGGFVSIASPKLSATATNVTSPNESILSGSSVGFLLRLDGAWKLNSWLSAVGEVGYRVLKANSPTLTAAGGANIFGTPPTAVPIDMSGPLVDVGLKASF